MDVFSELLPTSSHCVFVCFCITAGASLHLDGLLASLI